MLLRITIFCFLSYLIACSSSKRIANTTAVNAGKSDSLAGLDLVRKSDCITCHRIEGELPGPSFTDIAGKYELNTSNIDKLSKKIISGGNGVWGQIPMTPHPSLPEDDAKAMVKYILLLKK
jgi:cytochrome c